jgi:hypothetical protein
MQKEKGQIAIILIGVAVVGIFAGLYFTGILGGKGEKTTTPTGQEPTGAVTASGPERSNLYPTGTMPAGTKETRISVSTNVEAYCRYSKEPGKDYSSMSGSFSYDKAKTFHSVKAIGLDAGQTYTYYVRCRDMDNQKNTDDAIIRFTIGTIVSSPSSGSTSGSSSSGAVPPVLTNLYPTGTLPAGTSETEMSVQTNEAAYCRYSTTPGVAYNSMTKSFSYDKAKLVHTINVVGLEDNKVYEYYVKCRDMAGNRNTSDVVVRFGVGGVNYSPYSPTSPGQDVTPPYRYDGVPKGDATKKADYLPTSTRQTLISLKTDEKAICRYSDVSGIGYGQMKLFDTTNDISHSTQVSGFNEGQTYKYYIKCSDEHNNINTDDFIITFKVAPPDDVAPPVITILYPYSDVIYTTREVQLIIQTNESASCRYATEQGVAYNSMKKSFTKQSANQHAAKITGLQDYVYYSFFVRCKDLEGNVNTGDIMINFQFAP